MKLKLGLLMLMGSAGMIACVTNKASRDSGAESGISTPVEGGPCLVEGQQSACAKDGYPYACGPCQGHWLLCQGEKWIPVHCDPQPPIDPRPDAAVDARDTADVPSDVSATLDSRSTTDTAPIDGIDSSADGPVGSGLLPGAPAFACSRSGPNARCPRRRPSPTIAQLCCPGQFDRNCSSRPSQFEAGRARPTPSFATKSRLRLHS
jgi:hypothetical protein